MATAIPTLSETQALRDLYREIDGVEQVYARIDRSRVAVTVIVNSRDAQLLNRIFDVEGEMMDYFPGTEFAFDVIFRDDRTMQEIGSPSGTLLFMQHG